MRRRLLFVGAGALALGSIPLLARGQGRGPLPAVASRPRRIAFVAGGSPGLRTSVFDAFNEGMGKLGYLEGRDYVVEWRFADGHYDRFTSFAAELIELKVDVIVCQRRSDFPSAGRSNLPSLQTARRPPRAGAFLLSGGFF